MPRAVLPPALIRSLAVLACTVLSSCSLQAADRTEAARIVELLKLEPGHTVADVGAGDGDFVPALANAVGKDGRVFATEVKEDLVEEIRELALAKDLTQVAAVLGDQNSTGLAPGCCDAILLRLVYHHFTEPAEMRENLKRALAPGGLLAVLDIVPQEDWCELPDVPDRGGHGIPIDDLVAEMVDAGFEWVESVSDWNGDSDRFAVLFRRGDGTDNR